MASPTPSASEVSFAMPFMVTCHVCGALHLQGARFTASEKVGLVAHADGYITWIYTMMCDVCDAKIELHTDRNAPGGFFVAALSKVATAESIAPSRTVMTSASVHDGSLYRDVASRRRRTRTTKVHRPEDGAEHKDGSELDRALQKREWRADTRATVTALASRHVARWENTPSREEARRVVAARQMVRQAAKLARRETGGGGSGAISGSSAAGALATQRSRTGRMGRVEYVNMRKAVRRLHRGGALPYLLASSASQTNSSKKSQEGSAE
jgi:hypothetical protein